MNKGKKLENDVKKYLKSNSDFFHKFTDSYASRGISQTVPADFIIWPTNGPSILLECKESEKARIPLSAFRPSQFKAMEQSLETTSCNYYVLVCYNKEYYLIGAETILEHLDADLKSIDLNGPYLHLSSINEAMDMMMLDNNKML